MKSLNLTIQIQCFMRLISSFFFLKEALQFIYFFNGFGYFNYQKSILLKSIFEVTGDD